MVVIVLWYWSLCCVNSCRRVGCAVVLVVLYYETLLRCWSWCCLNSCRRGGRLCCGAGRVSSVVVLVVMLCEFWSWCWRCCGIGRIVLRSSVVVLVALWCWSFCIVEPCCGISCVVALVVLYCEFLARCWLCCGFGCIVWRICIMLLVVSGTSWSTQVKRQPRPYNADQVGMVESNKLSTEATSKLQYKCSSTGHCLKLGIEPD